MLSFFRNASSFYRTPQSKNSKQNKIILVALLVEVVMMVVMVVVVMMITKTRMTLASCTCLLTLKACSQV